MQLNIVDVSGMSNPVFIVGVEQPDDANSDNGFNSSPDSLPNTPSVKQEDCGESSDSASDADPEPE